MKAPLLYVGQPVEARDGGRVVDGVVVLINGHLVVVQPHEGEAPLMRQRWHVRAIQ